MPRSRRRKSFESSQYLIELHDIRVAPAHVAKIVPMRPLFHVAYTLFGNDGPVAVREAVDDRGTYTAAGGATTHNDRVNVVPGEDVHQRCQKENRRRRLGEAHVMR